MAVEHCHNWQSDFGGDQVRPPHFMIRYGKAAGRADCIQSADHPMYGQLRTAPRAEQDSTALSRVGRMVGLAQFRHTLRRNIDAARSAFRFKCHRDPRIREEARMVSGIKAKLPLFTKATHGITLNS